MQFCQLPQERRCDFAQKSAEIPGARSEGRGEASCAALRKNSPYDFKNRIYGEFSRFDSVFLLRGAPWGGGRPKSWQTVCTLHPMQSAREAPAFHRY
jgi:hypothetical protein